MHHQICSDGLIIFPPDCGGDSDLLLQGMTAENRSRSDSAATNSEAGRETANISDRVQTLREKTTTLSETLDRIERDLRKAAGETKE